MRSTTYPVYLTCCNQMCARLTAEQLLSLDETGRASMPLVCPDCLLSYGTDRMLAWYTNDLQWHREILLRRCNAS